MMRCNGIENLHTISFFLLISISFVSFCAFSLDPSPWFALPSFFFSHPLLPFCISLPPSSSLIRITLAVSFAPSPAPYLIWSMVMVRSFMNLLLLSTCLFETHKTKWKININNKRRVLDVRREQKAIHQTYYKQWRMLLFTHTHIYRERKQKR